MKRFWIIAFAILLTLALLGCTKQESSYIVNKNGTDYFVDTENKTISDDRNTYKYKFSGDASSFSITITYPNGSSYWCNQSEGHWTGGWSDDYDENAYVSADTLVDILQEKAPKRVNPGKITGALILIALGVFNAVLPYASWYLGNGWRYKNAEPSEAALIGYRITGTITIIVGIILLLI